MQYKAVMGVSSTGGRSKNGTFRGYTGKNDTNRHGNDVHCGPSAMVYQRSGAGNQHFCNLLAKIEDHINMILNLFFTGNAIQSCYVRLKSTGGRSKNGIFRVYTVKNDRNRHENDVICGPSLCFASHVCTQNAIFVPATGRLDTGLTAVYGIFR